MSLNDEIGSFGGLVGLALALATLFTSWQASALNRLRGEPTPTRGEAWREVAIDAALATATTLVFLAGLPLWVDSVRELHPLADGGPLRSVFVIVWILLVGLIAWQVALVAGAWRFKQRVPR